MQRTDHTPEPDAGARPHGITRGDFLRSAALGGIALGFPAAFASAARAAPPVGPVAGGAIDFFSWQGYDLKGVPAMDAWVKAHNVTVNSGYVNANSDIIAKVQNPGGVPYNLSTQFMGLFPLMRQLDMLLPLDISQIPNVKHLYAPFRTISSAHHFWIANGQWWGVPFTWNIGVMNYRAVVKPPPSWAGLLKPEWKGRVGWAGGVDGAMLTACIVLGYKPSTLTTAQFNDAFAFLRKMRAQCKAFGITFGELANLMSSGDIDVSYNGWAYVDILAAAKGAKVKSFIPAEGGYGEIDSYFIPKTATDTAVAYAFINEALTPSVQAQANEGLGQATTIPGGYADMTPASRSLYPYKAIAKVFSTRAPLFDYPPLTTTGKVVGYDQWTTEWAKLQAGA